MKEDELIQYLKKLRQPNKYQKRLLDLHHKGPSTTEEKSTYAALVKAELSANRAAKAKTRARTLINDERKKQADEERKARNHRLILQGTLIDLAGLQGRSRGELLGMMLTTSAFADEEHWAEWKRKGDALLADKGEQL